LSEEELVQQPEETLKRADAFKQDVYFWLQALVMALVCLILVFTFVGRMVSVDGSSMFPTLHDNDMILLQSIGYTPRQGDVVVLTKESFLSGKSIVKRVIAVGGQTVDIDYDAGTVSVDGEVLDEPYINELMREPGGFETITHMEVPEGSIFVMGDNRNDSSDSRHVNCGAVDTRYVLGRVFFVAFPFTNFGTVN